MESHRATSKLRSQLAMRTITDAKPLLAALRMKKSRQEIELIQHAVDVSVEAQLAAWKRVRPGTFSPSPVPVPPL